MKSFKFYKALVHDILVVTKEKILLRKPAVILMYHSIGNNGEPFTVTAKNFEWQMNYLRRHQHNVISLKTLGEHLISQTTIPPKTVVVTFDDGYRDNYTTALPILKKYEIPATIFLATNYMDGHTENKKGKRFEMLRWLEIEEMAKPGLVDFQSHTASHPRLATLTVSEIEYEIVKSKDIIKSHVGGESRLFAYPFGNVSSVVASVAGRHFDVAVTVERGFVNHRSPRFLLPRNGINSSVDSWRFRFLAW